MLCQQVCNFWHDEKFISVQPYVISWFDLGHQVCFWKMNISLDWVIFTGSCHGSEYWSFIFISFFLCLPWQFITDPRNALIFWSSHGKYHKMHPFTQHVDRFPSFKTVWICNGLWLDFWCQQLSRTTFIRDLHLHWLTDEWFLTNYSKTACLAQG